MNTDEQEVRNDEADTTDTSSLENSLEVSDSEFDVNELLSDSPESDTDEEAELTLEEKLERAERKAEGYEGTAKKFQSTIDSLDPSIIDILKNVPKEQQAEFVQSMLVPKKQEQENPEQKETQSQQWDWEDKQSTVDALVNDPTGTLFRAADDLLQQRYPQIAEAIEKQIMEKLDGKYSRLTEREDSIHVKETEEKLFSYAQSEYGLKITKDEKDPLWNKIEDMVSSNRDRYLNSDNLEKQVIDDLYLFLHKENKRKKAQKAKAEVAQSPMESMAGKSKVHNLASDKVARVNSLRDQFTKEYNG